MIDANKLIELIETKQLDYEENVKVLKTPQAIEQTKIAMRAMLTDPDHQKYRSAVCGIIRELNDTEALEILWKIINDPASKGKRGSLVYAMEFMNPIEYLGPLVRLVINDNFEVSNNAMATIYNLDGKVDDGLLNQLYKEVKQALTETSPSSKSPPILPTIPPSMQKWRKEALEILLEEFEPYK